MPEGIRVELTGALSGYHVVLDGDGLTIGLLEDLDSNKVATVVGAIASVILDGDLPYGNDHAALRKLKVDQFKSLVEALKSAFTVPKGR